MTELIRNAGTGWTVYKSSGKAAALLLAVLVFLWFTGKGREQMALLLYTTVAAICSILPVTAVLLMLYQTKFYDYEWIWSLVPLTAVTAYGLTLFLERQWKEAGSGGWRRALPVTLLLLLAVLLSGKLGGGTEERTQQNAWKEESAAVVELLHRTWPGEDICLLAPRKILEYAREADGRLRLPYGRNIWDPALNAYAYDTYGEREADLCQWMDWVEQSAWVWMPEDDREQMLQTLEERAKDAVELGVNCVLFPAGAPAEMRLRMEAALGTKAQPLGDDYIAFVLF